MVSARHIIDTQPSTEPDIAASEAEQDETELPPTRDSRRGPREATPFQVFGVEGKVVWGKPTTLPYHARDSSDLEGVTSYGLLWTDRQTIAFWQPSEDKFPDDRPQVYGVPGRDMYALIASAEEEKNVDLLPYRVSFTDTPPGSRLTVAQWLSEPKTVHKEPATDESSRPAKSGGAPAKMRFKLTSESLVLKPKATDSAQIIAAIKNLEQTLADLASRPAPDVNVHPEITIEQPKQPRKWKIEVTERDNSEERRIKTLTIVAQD